MGPRGPGTRRGAASNGAGLAQSDAAGVMLFADPRAIGTTPLPPLLGAIGARVVTLDPNRDGWRQVADRLARTATVRAIVLLPHVRPGRMMLGSTLLGSAPLAGLPDGPFPARGARPRRRGGTVITGPNRAALRAIGAALGPHGAMLLCGRLAAPGPVLRHLARCSGLTVAALDEGLAGLLALAQPTTPH